MTRNARVIIPVVLVFWVGALLLRDRLNEPAIFIPAAILFGATCLVVPFFLMSRGTGWHKLAKAYPLTTPFTGRWRVLRSFYMTADSTPLPTGTRFSSVVRLGIGGEHLHIGTFPIVDLLFPTIQLPWKAIAVARRYTGTGWVASPDGPGALLRATYDPGFKGTMIEIETAAPTAYLHMPAEALGEAVARLPFAREASPLGEERLA